MKSSAFESKPFHSRSRGEIPGRARRKERLSRSKLNIRELKNHDEVHDDDVGSLGKDWNENVGFGGKKES